MDRIAARALRLTFAALLLAAAPAHAAPFTIAKGFGFSIAAAPDGTAYAVTRDNGRLTACVLPYGARKCATRTRLSRPRGEQQGFKLLRRPSDGALFVLDHRGTKSIYVHTSTDGGLTWSAPVLVATGFPELADAALAADGEHADVVGGVIGPANYARVALAGPPVVPLLNLSAEQRRHKAVFASIASLDSGAVITEFQGAYTSKYGFRFHAPGGDLAADEQWTRWRPLFDGHDQHVFAGEGQAYLARVVGRLEHPELKLQKVRADGTVGASRLVHKRLDGFEPDGAVIGGTLHVVVTGLITIQYTRTAGSCWFGKRVTFTDAGPTGVKLAMSTPDRGLIAWDLGPEVRGVWTRGGVDPACSAEAALRGGGAS